VYQEIVDVEFGFYHLASRVTVHHNKVAASTQCSLRVYPWPQQWTHLTRQLLRTYFTYSVNQQWWS